MADFVPSEDEISAAIEGRDSALIARFALALDKQRRDLRAGLPQLLEAAANAKRDLDVRRAAIKNNDQTISLLQSVLKDLRVSY
jgi:hypothetical protein